jgi:hypothetical protein
MKRENGIAATGSHSTGVKRRELFQYDGSRLIGTIIVGRDGKAKAFNSARKGLGAFPDFRAAMAAVSRAHLAADGARQACTSAQMSANAISGASRGAETG